ncbi:MAG TPA: RNase H family protein [Methylomirabilota bacterium]|nr:RNase H family protein [Methylomirabilota bacterium]
MKICRICGSKLIEKATKRTAEQLKKPYYYTAYYYCPHCKKLYHDERFKVTNEPPTPFLPLQNDDELYDVEIWTDGACINNGKPTARAAWAFVSGKTERAGLVIGKQTNNVAEGLAIYKALTWAAEQKHKNIKLHTDSQISIYNLKKLSHQVKMNREIFENIERLINNLHLTITYVKVLGHSGDPNNDRVDKLANDLARNFN